MQVGKDMGIIMRQSQSCLAKKFSGINITLAEYMFLINIPDEKHITQKEICVDLVIDEAAATRAVKTLNEKKLVAKIRSKKDKRAFEISLTDEGKKKKVIVLDILDEWNDVILGGFTEENKSVIQTYLEVIKENTLDQKEK